VVVFTLMQMWVHVTPTKYETAQQYRHAYITIHLVPALLCVAAAAVDSGAVVIAVAQAQAVVRSRKNLKAAAAAL
jgi:hypothetical protein